MIWLYLLITAVDDAIMFVSQKSKENLKSSGEDMRKKKWMGQIMKNLEKQVIQQ